MVEIDLRPTDVKYRAVGTSRLATLIGVSERLTRIVLPIVIALTYLRYLTGTLSETKNARHAELRELSDGATETSKRKRQEPKITIKARQARERALALDTLFDALERTSIPEVSLIELSAQGSSVVVKGEVADISALHAFLLELERRVEGVAMTVESMREESSNLNERHNRFSVRILFAGRPSEARGDGDNA